MEPQDPAKNNENGGFSKRRISSILKAPRKSIRFPDPELQENRVESTKFVEKRNSRRVSFAPANDVLLFSKDVKNTSPARSPFQELVTTAATQNRVQVAVTDDGTQPIAGMETLLNAPLHASQQKDMVNCDTGEDLGEKTVIFSTDDDAFMDMTHSNTINIGIDGDMSHQDCDAVPTSGEKMMIFGADDVSMDLTLNQTTNLTASLPAGRGADFSAEKENVASSGPCLDPVGFENFLANLFPTKSIKAANVDKENQAPASVSAVMDRSLNANRNTGESPFQGSLLYPKDDMSMEMTEALTSHVQGLIDKADPFQCLFPTKEMYSHVHNSAQQTTEESTGLQSSKAVASLNPKDTASLKNPPLRASHQGPKVNLDANSEHREKTIMFTAGDEFMDMTQSHTVNIARASHLHTAQQHPGPSNTTGIDTSLKPWLQTHQMKSEEVCREKTRFSADNDGMEMTQSHTANITTNLSGQDLYPQSGQPKKTDTIPHQLHGQTFRSSSVKDTESSLSAFLKAKTPKHQLTDEDDCRERTARFTADDGCMDETQCHTVNILSSLQAHSNQKSDSLPACGERTVRFSATDAAMDVTQCHTSHIATNLLLTSHQNLDFFPGGGEKTVKFSSNDACMDVTQSHTVNIATNLCPQSHKYVDFLQGGGEKTVRFNADDAAMDETRSHTTNIATGFKPKSHQSVDLLPARGEQTVRFTANDACMDVTQSHTTNIATFNPKLHQNTDFFPGGGEKTVRFTANDATMDVTQSHTVNIATNLYPQSHQDAKSLPGSGEKTLRFSSIDATMEVTQSYTTNIATSLKPRSHQSADPLPAGGERTVSFPSHDTAMDITKSHTVNIAANLKPQSHQNAGPAPANGEKTVSFSSHDAAMDVTKSHTVNIAASLKPQSHQDLDFLTEKTVRFSSNDAAMDVTQSHTTNIATSFNSKSHKDLDITHARGEKSSSHDGANVVPKSCAVNSVTSLPASGEKTMRFSSSDITMDVTKSHTVHIATEFEPQSPPNGGLRLIPTSTDKMVTCTANDSAIEVAQSCTERITVKSDSGISCMQENTQDPLSVSKRDHRRAPSVHYLDPGLKTSLSEQNVSLPNPPQESVDQHVTLFDVDTKASASAVMENPVDKSMTVCPEEDMSMDLTEAQTGRILGQIYADDPPLSLPGSDTANKEVTLQQGNEGLAPFISDSVEVTNRPQPLDSGNKNPPPSSDTGNDVKAAPSRKSRRLSLADLQSKVRRLSHIVNTAPDPIATDEYPAPLELGPHPDENSKDKTVMEAQLEMVAPNPEEKTQAHDLLEEEQPATIPTTPFNLKTKQLMSRLSVGGFKPKLPQRSSGKKTHSRQEHTKTITVCVSNQLEDFDGNVSDIYDEELASCEDTTDVLDMRSPQRAAEIPSQELCDEGTIEDHVFEEECASAASGKKRPLPEDDCHMEGEKRKRRSTEMTTDPDTGAQYHDGNTTAAGCTATQPTDDLSISHTTSMRCEATFNSTSKQSLFESQLEDYASDTLRRLENGNITVSEFFKLCNIDFVIHNPRQSILPGRLLSDSDRTPMDSLKDRHIHRPKQMVYETDVRELTEQVEGLKERMQDLDKPLRTFNRALWEEVRNCSQAEFKAFGAKLKERNNLFRKTSKVHSHEMKEVLYSRLVQASREEQQSLKGTIEKADEMIRSLDDCIRELETELAAVEETGDRGTKSLKSLQEEMQSVTRTLEDNSRKICELEMQKKQSSTKLSRLKAETRNFDDHIAALHMLNEWRLGERTDNQAVYTFLHDTLHLQLVYQKSTEGNDATDQPERKISHIAFKRQLDDERSQGHACLVHALLSHYIEGEAAWAKKYPTSRHVPQLLHDVSLSVSHCRLLGEELRLLKMWGALKLGILSISCSDTQVHIVFSSLKKLSKFEVVMSVSLVDHLYVLQLHSFTNIIGGTTVQQIEEIMASFSPARNILTKIVKKIHASLLS